MTKGMVILIAAIMLCTIFSGCEKKSKTTKTLNVLFIAVDDLRPELACYGADYMHTPNIDKLASEGRVFTNHFVHCAACGPSRSTLLSGRRTTNWDIFKNIRESGSKPDSIFSLPQLFKESGYMTVGIGKISHQPGGVMDSLQTIYEVPYSWNKSYAPVGIWKDPWQAFFSYEGGKARTSYYGRPTNRTLSPFEAADVTDNGYADGLNAEEAIKQLRNLQDTSFFLAVGFYKPHLPFNAPKKYWDLYEPDEIPEADYNESPQNIKSRICLHNNRTSYEPRGTYTWPDDSLWWQVTPEREKVLKHGYCAAVSYVDAQIGKVLDELKRLGLDKNTVVVLWGDHGWHLGDYGIWGKHTNFDIALNSPLIIKTPELNKNGVFADGMVETVDIFPTLTDLCDLKTPDYLWGKSLKPLLNDPSAKIKNHTVGERDAWGIHGITVRDENYRLMVWIDKETGDTVDVNLFDNMEQPIPHNDVSMLNPDKVTELQEKMSRLILNN